MTLPLTSFEVACVTGAVSPAKPVFRRPTDTRAGHAGSNSPRLSHSAILIKLRTPRKAISRSVGFRRVVWPNIGPMACRRLSHRRGTAVAVETKAALKGAQAKLTAAMRC